MKEFENTVASASSQERGLSLVVDPDSGITLYTFPDGGQPQKIDKHGKNLVVGNWNSGTDGQYTNPVKLSDAINTQGDEDTPFIA